MGTGMTKVKERGILFSGEMVRAIPDGPKTQTRRVAKLTASGRIKEPGRQRNWHPDDPEVVNGCPYGKPGDRLYVRESGWVWGQWVKNGTTKSGRQKWRFNPIEKSATYEAQPNIDRTSIGWHKRPSIHMPRWASRILLEITDIRVERLQEISERDARAEGVLCGYDYNHDGDCHIHKDGCSKPLFMQLWDSINAKRIYDWKSNPWVWVIKFQKITP